MLRPILAVGWDAGGWHGRKQAVAVATIGRDRLDWHGTPALFSIEQLNRMGGSAVDLIHLAWPDAPADVLETHDVTIAIDAPLGFPDLFARVVTAEDAPMVPTSGFYENPLAFRETDRWVYRTFGKRPLSAPFDKLGNNAVTAIIHARRWARRHGFQISPQQGEDRARRTIIEVYPALVKRPDGGGRVCYEPVERLLPAGVVPGSDQYDAAICCVLAAAFAMDSAQTKRFLPPILTPPEDFPRSALRTEGWIYSAPLEWVTTLINYQRSPVDQRHDPYIREETV